MEDEIDPLKEKKVKKMVNLLAKLKAEKFTLIAEDELKALEDSDQFLTLLENEGVDNWVGYHLAVEAEEAL